MDRASHSPIGAVLLADGLSNSAGLSGQAWIDQAAQVLGWQTGWTRYEPHSYDGRSVETTAVFPHFFGLTPERNPGRAGLERILDGDLHDDCGHFAVIQGMGTVRDIETRFETSVHLRPSSYSPSGNSWLVCSPDQKSRDDFLHDVRSISPVVRVAHVVSPDDDWLAKTQESVLAGERHFLIGWCHGALLSAFQLCGVRMSPLARFESDPSKTRSRRIIELGEQLDKCMPTTIRPIVYLKDSAWDARRSTSKDAAFEFTVRVLQRLFGNPEIESVLVLSDHNSEPGVDETSTGQTVAGVVATTPNVVDRWNDYFRFNPLTQSELVEALDTAWL